MKKKLLILTAIMLAAGLATTQSHAQSNSESAKVVELPDSETRALTYVTDEEDC